jgi:HD-GYP domain-containing protein (c-di-GMP phosphodiesterase class II)
LKDNRFMAIPPGAIVPGSLPKFRIYVLTEKGQYLLWAQDGNEVTPGQLERLSNSGPKEVFIDLEEEVKYEEYLETHLGSILDNQGPTDDQKATIFSKVSTNVVKDAFEASFGAGSMDSNTIKRTQRMIKNALIFVTESKSLQPLTKMIGHDYRTYEHATKVLWFTVAFLKQNPDILPQIQTDYEALKEDQRMEVMRQCGVGALLHDIGKAFVSQEILNKNGPLDPIEWEIMKRHPLNGLAMLLDSAIPDFVRKAVLYHHEDYHGGGYPMGIEGQSITPLARVVRIIDVFDAMTSRRPYKEPVPPLKAMQIMVGTPPDRNGGEADPGSDKRDLGMRRCFDEDLLRRFVVFLGNLRFSA